MDETCALALRPLLTVFYTCREILCLQPADTREIVPEPKETIQPITSLGI